MGDLSQFLPLQGQISLIRKTTEVLVPAALVLMVQPVRSEKGVAGNSNRTLRTPACNRRTERTSETSPLLRICFFGRARNPSQTRETKKSIRYFFAGLFPLGISRWSGPWNRLSHKRL